MKGSHEGSQTKMRRSTVVVEVFFFVFFLGGRGFWVGGGRIVVFVGFFQFLLSGFFLL